MPDPATPVLDFAASGLRHRKWIFPAFVYSDGEGVSAEMHYYVVGDAPFAVSFTVHTGRYPEGRGPDSRPYGTDVSWHRKGEHGHEGCYALSGDTCYGDGSSLEAMEWYEHTPKDADGLVPDDTVFVYLRETYAEWER
jgi:hypothetical protein